MVLSIEVCAKLKHFVQNVSIDLEFSVALLSRSGVQPL
jgi:hypothetical protein